MDCPRCGRTAQEGVVYCGYCGWKIESDVTPPEEFSSKLSELPEELAELVPLDTWKTKTSTEARKPLVEEFAPLAERDDQALVQATLPLSEASQLMVPEAPPTARRSVEKRASGPRKPSRKGAGKKSARRTKRKSK